MLDNFEKKIITDDDILCLKTVTGADNLQDLYDLADELFIEECFDYDDKYSER